MKDRHGKSFVSENTLVLHLFAAVTDCVDDENAQKMTKINKTKNNWEVASNVWDYLHEF